MRMLIFIENNPSKKIIEFKTTSVRHAPRGLTSQNERKLRLFQIITINLASSMKCILDEPFAGLVIIIH